MEDLDRFGRLVERLGRLLQRRDVETESVGGRGRADAEQLLVELLGEVALSERQASTDHSVEDRRPAVTNHGILREDGHVRTRHGENLTAEVHLSVAGGARDELGVGDVPRVAAGPAHVAEATESIVQLGSLAPVAAFQVIGDER